MPSPKAHVALAPSVLFASGEDQGAHVRISLGVSPTREDLARGLRALMALET
jgi:hypothetical protein